MRFEEFIGDYLEKDLIKRQRIDFKAAEKLILRSHKKLKAAKANLIIDEGIAFMVAYLAMLHAGRAFMLGLLTELNIGQCASLSIAA